MYAPFGNNGIRSSGRASFFSNEGLRTLDFSAAEAVKVAADAMLGNEAIAELHRLVARANSKRVQVQMLGSGSKSDEGNAVVFKSYDAAA